MQWYLNCYMHLQSLSSSFVKSYPRMEVENLFFYFFYLLLLVKQVCHRDLKLENTLLDGSPAPRLKICDFGYSKVLISLFPIAIIIFCCLNYMNYS